MINPDTYVRRAIQSLLDSQVKLILAGARSHIQILAAYPLHSFVPSGTLTLHRQLHAGGKAVLAWSTGSPLFNVPSLDYQLLLRVSVYFQICTQAQETGH